MATVVVNEKICDEHFLLRLYLAEFPSAAAGQFVQLQCRPPVAQAGAAEVARSEAGLPEFSSPELTDKESLLRRPLSLAGRRVSGDGVELEIIYRVVGTGTGWLAGTRAGQAVSVLGPLGNALPIIPDKPQVALVAGGVGIPPMIYMANALHNAGKSVTAFNGVRSKSLLPLSPGSEPISPEGLPRLCCSQFQSSDASAVVASDDGTVGYHGLVTEPFDAWLDGEAKAAAGLVVYSCGPEPMMRAVGEICIRRGIECYLSLERHMACGMGTCQSCIVKIRDDSPQGWSYKLCCTHGPAFDARDIIW
ncbi:MAG: dihydroorotate dehydrogenase electron transfer subunit [Phycisphaerae bacterium]|nr:dihydroorotate dehydrogenase electron transfer subunit [Phycisphaerae bacterium]